MSVTAPSGPAPVLGTPCSSEIPADVGRGLVLMLVDVTSLGDFSDALE